MRCIAGRAALPPNSAISRSSPAARSAAAASAAASRAYVADYALIREAGGIGLAGAGSEVLAALFAAARGGDPRAAEVVGRAETMFAVGLANLVTLFDPELIVLSGERLKFDYLVSPAVLAMIRDYLHPGAVRPPEIVIHRWGNLMWARGAAAFAIDGVADRAILELDRDAA